MNKNIIIINKNLKKGIKFVGYKFLIIILTPHFFLSKFVKYKSFSWFTVLHITNF